MKKEHTPKTEKMTKIKEQEINDYDDMISFINKKEVTIKTAIEVTEKFLGYSLELDINAPQQIKEILENMLNKKAINHRISLLYSSERPTDKINKLIIPDNL